MGSACDVKIELDRTQTDGTFTNHDIINGVVTLIVTTSISLNYIQVKLQGISKSELSIPRESRKRNDNRMKNIVDIHRVLYDTVIVFPPDNIRNVSNAREFTLVPGNYTYPFEFRIPLNNSCVKLQGLTNKISFNKKKMDFTINNGNFNTKMLKNLTNQVINNQVGGGAGGGAGGGITSTTNSASTSTRKNYHITAQLPPSLSGMDDFASIKYFVKVTCKRSSILKTNLRSFDPFVFLPLDLDSHMQPIMSDYEEYREVFVRKELIFKNRIPEIIGIKIPKPPPANIPVKKGFFGKMFDSSSSSTSNTANQPPPQAPIPEITSKDVPFSFEIRFRHPAFLIPMKNPSFKLYLVSKLNPSRYTLGEYDKPDESNGLGIIYLHRLIIKLTSTTSISILEDDGSSNEIHQGSHQEIIPICDNIFDNLKFDLKNGRNSRTSPQSSIQTPNQYEIEIPNKYFKNARLPNYLSPSFKTCNITRSYDLSIAGGFTSERTKFDKNNPKIKYVELQCANIKVLSGLTMTSSLHSNASRSSISKTNHNDSRNSINRRDSQLSVSAPTPPMPARPSEKQQLAMHEASQSINSSEDEIGLNLPTYDDVMRESSFQNDSEHQGARRRYQQHAMYYQDLDG